MDVLRRILDVMTIVSATLAGLALVLIVGVIFADVIAREAGNALQGAQDVTSMAFVVMVFGAMSLTDRKGGHIAVDLFEKSYSAGFNRLLDIVIALLGAVIFLAIAYATWESAKLSQMLNLSTNLINLPKYWFQWALSAFATISALSMILRAVELGRGHDIRHDRSEAPT